MRQERILNLLERLAQENEGVADGRVRMASAIVHKKRIISTGINRMKSHPIMLDYGYREGQYYVHAEVDAIVKSNITDFSKCDLYVLRLKRPSIGAKNYIYGIAKPCVGCAELISTYEFRNVYYTTDNGTLSVL